jgi:hypothetical protein
MSLSKLTHIQKVLLSLEHASKVYGKGLRDSADSLVRQSGYFGGASYPSAVKLFRQHEPLANTLLGGIRKTDWAGAQKRLGEMLAAAQPRKLEQAAFDFKIP